MEQSLESQKAGLAIRLLGAAQLLRGSEVVSNDLSQKALGLLAYLAMRPGQAATRERLSGMFWGETDDEHASFNLRRALWSLRKAINPPGSPSDFYIRYEQGSYLFHRSADYWIDVTAFERATNQALRPGLSGAVGQAPASPIYTPAGMDRLRSAVQLYRGKLLEGCRPRGCSEFLDWLYLQRNRLERSYIECLRSLAVHCAIQNRYQEAITYYKRILSVDPLHESARSDLMVAYYVLGRRDKAVAQYLEFDKLLRQQLDLEPLPETQTLYRDIRNGTLTVAGASYWLATARGSARPAAPAGVFVGREGEQAQLNRILSSVGETPAQLVVIRGEAGVGKTRLVQEFLFSKTDPSIAFLIARCHAQEQGLLYQPIIDALRTYLAGADFAYIKRLSQLWLAEVAKLLPELHAYLPHLPVSLGLTPDQDRNRLFEGLAQFITHLSKRERLIFFIDDLHAADSPTLDLVHYLARRLAGAAVMLVGTLRNEALAEHAALAAMLRELERDQLLVTIPLARLSEPEVLEFVKQTARASVGLRQLGQRLYRQTGGNPFFVTEMLKELEERPVGAGDELNLPSNVRKVIGHRLRRLDQNARQVISLASVIGRQFAASDLQQIVEWDKDSLLGVLDRLQLTGWLAEPAGIRPGSYEFSHGLVRDAVYQSLGAARRTELHRRVGLALERNAAESDELAGVLAHHFWKAAEASRGATYALRAASHARGLHAYGEAISHYLRVLKRNQAGELILRSEQLLEIHFQLGRCYELLGKYGEALAAYQSGLPEVDLGDSRHRRIQLQLAGVYVSRGEYDQSLATLRAIAAHVSKPTDSASRIEAAMVSRGIASVHLSRERSRRALAHSRRALSLIGEIDMRSADPETSRQLTGERTALYEIMANSYFHLGEYEQAVSHFRLALESARQQDDRPAEARLLIGLGQVARRRGDYRRAAGYARQSRALCAQIGHISGEAAALGLQGDVAYNRGSLGQAIARYNQALDICKQIGDQHGIADRCLCLAFVKIDMDQIAQAEDHLREALAIGRELNARLVLIRAQYHLARVARARGDLDEAMQRVERMLEAARGAGIRLLEAAGHHLLGDILLQMQRPRQGELHMMEGLRLFEVLGDRFETAWTLRSYARLLKQRGDTSRARPQLQRAAAIFAELGAERELQRTESELAQ